MSELNDLNVFNVKSKPSVEPCKKSSIEIQDVICDFLLSISKSHLNCFVVKGCMALNNHFLNNKLSFARMTTDLDLHSYSKDDWEEFVSSSADIATKNSLHGITYTLVSRRGYDKNPNGDSLKFKAKLNDDIVEFKIDMNFGGDVEIVEYNDHLCLYSIPVILSDKISVLATRKVCRRIKDLIDIYLICSNLDLNYLEVCYKIEHRLNTSNRTLDFNNLYFLSEHSFDEMNHAFNKYDQSIDLNVSFEDVFKCVLDFTIPIYLFLNGTTRKYNLWDHNRREWL